MPVHVDDRYRMTGHHERNLTDNHCIATQQPSSTKMDFRWLVLTAGINSQCLVAVSSCEGLTLLIAGRATTVRPSKVARVPDLRMLSGIATSTYDDLSIDSCSQ